MEFYELQQKGIAKRVLHGGRGDIPEFVDGTKVFFHYLVQVPPNEQSADAAVVDDSRKSASYPMELVIGKKFKLEFWEDCLKSMRIAEVAGFTVPTSMSCNYPSVGKMLRDIRAGRQVGHSHCGGHLAEAMWTSHEDLWQLFRQPKPLEFIFELLSVEQPESYTKDNWMLSDEERRQKITTLRQQGNDHYRQGNYKEADAKYFEAIGLVEQLLTKEAPQSDEAVELRQLKYGLLLNYCQTQLSLENWYEVIRYCDEILADDQSNVKALWRRGRARYEIWSLDEASQDFERAKQLDPSLSGAVDKNLKMIAVRRKQKDQAEKTMFKDIFAS